MKIKTNIYHFTADNGLQYEDFTGYSEVVYAQNEDEAIKKGVAMLQNKLGQDATICHAEAFLVYENVEMDVPVPLPLRETIGCLNFKFDFETKNLTIDGFYVMTPADIDKLRRFLERVISNLK